MLKQLVFTFALVSFVCSFALAQEETNTEMKESQNHMQMEHMKSDSSMEEMQNIIKMDDSNTTISTKIWNKVCPVKGEEVDPEAPTVEYNGKLYGFCCPGCDRKFEKDPEKYSQNLSEDGTEFIGNK